MADGTHMRVAHGAGESFHDLGLGLTEPGMDAGRYEVQVGQAVVGQVEPSIGQDVHLDAGEKPDAFETRVQLSYGLDLRQQSLGPKPPVMPSAWEWSQKQR